MCHWSGGDEGSAEKGTSEGWAFECVPGPGRCGYGTDAVGRGAAGSPALSLHPLCRSGQAWPISLVVGPWHLNIPLCYFHTKRSSGLPQAQPLPLRVIGLAPAPPASNSPSWCSHKPAPAHTPALQLPKAQASPPIAREVSRGAFAPTLG